MAVPSTTTATPKRRRWSWPEFCLIAALALLVAQLAPDALRMWHEWPRPGRQTPARVELTPVSGDPFQVRYWIYLPEKYSKAERWPLLLFLHGKGECGDDLNRVLDVGIPAEIAKGKQLPMIVVSPQCREHWDSRTLLALIDQVTREYSIDKERIYVSGYSMGANATWALASATPERFAALVPVSGVARSDAATRLQDVPIWAFHGARDEGVSPEPAKAIVSAIATAGGNAKLTLFPDRGHDITNLVYGRDELYEWLLKQHRSTEMVDHQPAPSVPLSKAPRADDSK